MRIGAFELLEAPPQLREPHAIALLRPWIDAGSVGTQVLTRLERHLGAQELGKLARPGLFFDFTRYRPITRITEGQRTLTVPNTTVSYARCPHPPDFLLARLLEPHANAEEYVDSVLQLFQHFGVKRYIRVGGMYDAVPHTRPLLVTGTLDGKPLEGIPGVNPSRGSAYQGPTSIMNLVSDALGKQGVQNLSLMVHLPQYLELEEDHTGAARLLQALCSLYGFSSDLADFSSGQRQYAQANTEVERHSGMKALVRQLEAYYDSRVAAPEEPPSPLSPEIQQFLRDIGRRLEGP